MPCAYGSRREKAGGEPINRDFFNTCIAGRHNPDIAADLFPSKSLEEQQQFSEAKEAYFRKIAAQGALRDNQSIHSQLTVRKATPAGL